MTAVEEPAVADEKIEAFEEQFVKPDKDKPTSVSDWFRKAVTLPRDTIQIFTDAKAAYEYTMLMDRQDRIHRETRTFQAKQEGVLKVEEQGLGDVPPFSAELEELDTEERKISDDKSDLIERLNKSALTVEMRALYPAEIRTLTRIAERQGTKSVMGDATPAQDTIDQAISRYSNAEYLSKSVVSMKTADGEVLTVPTAEEWLDIEDTLASSEFVKLVNKMSEMNVRAAIRDARTDAGFPG